MMRKKKEMEKIKKTEKKEVKKKVIVLWLSLRLKWKTVIMCIMGALWQIWNNKLFLIWPVIRRWREILSSGLKWSENLIINCLLLNVLVDVIRLEQKKYLVWGFMLLKQVSVNLLFMIILCRLWEELLEWESSLDLRIMKKELREMAYWLMNMLLHLNLFILLRLITSIWLLPT